MPCIRPVFPTYCFANLFLIFYNNRKWSLKAKPFTNKKIGTHGAWSTLWCWWVLLHMLHIFKFVRWLCNHVQMNSVISEFQSQFDLCWFEIYCSPHSTVGFQIQVVVSKNFTKYSLNERNCFKNFSCAVGNVSLELRHFKNSLRTKIN